MNSYRLVAVVASDPHIIRTCGRDTVEITAGVVDGRGHLLPLLTIPVDYVGPCRPYVIFGDCFHSQQVVRAMLRRLRLPPRGTIPVEDDHLRVFALVRKLRADRPYRRGIKHIYAV